MKINNLKIGGYLTVYAILLALSLKSCSVSMEEPFYVVRFNELIWQYIVPAIILTLTISSVFFATVNFYRGTLSVMQLLLVYLGLSVLALLSVEALYGYSWDLYHHVGIR